MPRKKNMKALMADLIDREYEDCEDGVPYDLEELSNESGIDMDTLVSALQADPRMTVKNHAMSGWSYAKNPVVYDANDDEEAEGEDNEAPADQAGDDEAEEPTPAPGITDSDGNAVDVVKDDEAPTPVDDNVDLFAGTEDEPPDIPAAAANDADAETDTDTETATTPATAADDKDEDTPDMKSLMLELNALRRKVEVGRSLAMQYSDLRSGEAELTAQLSDVRTRYKELAKQLAEHELNPLNLQSTIFDDSGILMPVDQHDKGGTPDAEAEADPGVLSPYEQGRKARYGDVGPDDCPFGEDMPDSREQWIMGYDEANVEAVAKPRADLDDRECTLEATGSTEEAIIGSFIGDAVVVRKEGKDPQAKPATLFTGQYVLARITASEDANGDFHRRVAECLPLVAIKEWKEHYEDDHGKALSMAGFWAEDAERAVGCVVKVSRKKFVIGPWELRLEVELPAEAEVEDEDEQAED